MKRSKEDQRDALATRLIRILLQKKCPVRIRDLAQTLGVDIEGLCAFIDTYPGNFERYDDGHGRFFKLITELSLCEIHCSKETCFGQLPQCTGLHICKYYVMSACRFAGKCHFGHDLTTSHNCRLLHQHHLDDANKDDIKFLLTNSQSRSEVLIPKICKFYNVQSGCERGNCGNLHICKHYIYGECKFGAGCRRSHNMVDPGIISILHKHGIDTKRPPKEVLSELRAMMRQDDNGKEDSSLPDRLNILQMNNDFSDYDHVTHRKGKRLLPTGMSRATSASNVSRISPNKAPQALDQGARPKTTTANRSIHDQKQKMMSLSVPNLQQQLSTETDTAQWICFYNLSGTCMFKERCFNGHYDLPYQWMYRKRPDDPWNKFCKHGGKDHNQELEITYSDPSNAECYLEFREGRIWEINFKTMKAKDKYEIKRLSTKSSSENERHPFATLWKWYWKDQIGKWKEYGETDCGYMSTITSGDIEQEYLARPGGQMMFATQGHQYILDFKEMVQKNIQYRTKRDVVRRPEFVDETTFSQKKRLCSQRKKATKGHDVEYGQNLAPPTWLNVEQDLSDHFQINQVHKKRSPREYSEIENLFFESMPNTFTITSIERIENGDLWLAFLSKQRKMEKRNSSKQVKELRLFHGTSSEYCMAICRQGFDFRLSGRSTGTLYGKGSYFSTTAKYSDAYTRSSERLIFVVRVLVGEYTKGKKEFVRPPSKDPSNLCSDLYDSCVDDPENPKIYVIFDNNGQVYPEYVIKYDNSLL